MVNKTRFNTSAYLPSLDGLRGVSILIVLLAHLGFENIVPGGFGVTIFFFISGYLITNLLIDEYLVTGRISLKLFYLRRILRLYPSLLIMIVCFTLYNFFNNRFINAREILAVMFYYENYYGFYTKSVQSFSTLWSLSVEEHFYLVFPFIFILLFNIPKKLMTVLIVLIFAALFFRCIGELTNTKEDAEWYCYLLTQCRFDSILYGCLASLFLYLDTKGRYIAVISNKMTFIGALLIIGLCLLIRNDVFRNTLRFSLQGISLFVLVPAIVNIGSYKNVNMLLSNKVIVFIGKLSYSIYLFHELAIIIVSPLQANGHNVLFILAAAGLTGLFAMASYYIIERPLGKIRKRLRPMDVTTKFVNQSV
jgi:peptidoglycan/LPS O-acetylase OafA/YrhL